MSIGLIPPNNPAAAAGLQLLGVYTISGGASIDIATRNQGSYTGNLFQSDFDDYEVRLLNLIPGTNNTTIFMRVSTNGGSSYDTSAIYDKSGFYFYSTGGGPDGNTGQTSWILATGQSNSANYGCNGNVTFNNPLRTSGYKLAYSYIIGYDTGVSNFVTKGYHYVYNSATAVNAVQVFPAAGTITGTILVYGKAKTASVSAGNVLGGTVVQVVNFQTGAVATGTTTIPFDDTIPQNTEGDQYMSLAITPKSATNKLRIDVQFFASNTAAPQNFCVALFQDSIANALACGYATGPTASYVTPVCFNHYMVAGTISSITLKVRAGSASPGTTTFNGVASGRMYGGVLASSITITEIAV